MKFLIAGGGTGGHVFTGIAVARELQQRPGKHTICFVGTAAGLEQKLVPQAGFRLILTRVSKLKGLGLTSKLRGVMSLPGALVSSAKILWQEKPDCVFGVGGYASGPIILLAAFLRIPTAIIEQNSIPGFANRILGRYVKRIFIAFDYARKFFPRVRCMWTGNPIRADVISQSLAVPKRRDRITVLIFGGSQGAEKIDRTVLESLSLIQDLSARVRFIHQTGEKFFDPLKKGYPAHGFEAEVFRFIDDMGRVYGEADLVICRSGAISMSEIATLGKAAIFIPFPFATDNHQEHNARALTDKGAGVLLLDRDLTTSKLSEIIRETVEHPERLQALSQKALQFSSFRAARDIVDACLLLIRKSG